VISLRSRFAATGLLRKNPACSFGTSCKATLILCRLRSAVRASVCGLHYHQPPRLVSMTYPSFKLLDLGLRAFWDTNGIRGGGRLFSELLPQVTEDDAMDAPCRMLIADLCELD